MLCATFVLDRFHITQHLNEAVDEVRRAESSRLRATGKAKAEQLKHMRWPLLRRGSRVRGECGKSFWLCGRASWPRAELGS